MNKEQIEELDALERKATPGPWKSMRSGNAPLNDNLVGQSTLSVPRPHEPSWIGWTNNKNQHVTFLLDEDADFIAALRNAWPALRDLAKRALAAEGEMPPIPDWFVTGNDYRHAFETVKEAYVDLRQRVAGLERNAEWQHQIVIKKDSDIYALRAENERLRKELGERK